jgi:surface protein
MTLIFAAISRIQGADAFSQDLCAWQAQVNPNASAWEKIFLDSGCPYTSEPTSVAEGPWCYDCTLLNTTDSTTAYVRGTAPYFETTGELYWAVDQYVKAVYYGNRTGDTFLVDDLIEQYGNVSEWDVSRLTDFSLVFYRGDRSAYAASATDLTNFVPEQTLFVDDISGWNVSLATAMEGMFAGAMNFSQNLSAWDTSRVSTMRAMFHSASSFNGDIGGWNVGSVTDFSAMFFGCLSFEGIELSAWDMSAAEDTSNMFAETGSLVGDLSKWSVGKVTSLEAMFRSSNFMGDLTWNTSRVGSMSKMVRQLTCK